MRICAARSGSALRSEAMTKASSVSSVNPRGPNRIGNSAEARLSRI
jgi:hypothetical protein